MGIGYVLGVLGLLDGDIVCKVDFLKGEDMDWEGHKVNYNVVEPLSYIRKAQEALYGKSSGVCSGEWHCLEKIACSLALKLVPGAHGGAGLNSDGDWQSAERS